MCACVCVCYSAAAAGAAAATAAVPAVVTSNPGKHSSRLPSTLPHTRNYNSAKSDANHQHQLHRQTYYTFNRSSYGTPSDLHSTIMIV